jgi:hypothetical protein
VSVLAHQLLLTLSVAALGAAALRVAAMASPTGLDRLVAAAALAAAAAVVQAVVLGLFGAGNEPVALGAKAGATWLAALRLAPAPAVSLTQDAERWWTGLGPGRRTALLAVAGALAAVAAWLARNPVMGVDGVIYHLPEIASWVNGGSPGAVDTVVYGFPVGNYPLTNEVLLAWGAGLSRSYAGLALYMPAMLALLGASGWLGLRALRVPLLPRGLAVAALCAAPLTVLQLHGPLTDLPALAWLCCAAALVARASDRPALLAPALVAAGLAVGTKTTVLPLTAILVVVAVVAHRRSLSRLAVPLGAALALAVAAGGVWYLRNLIDHGSPLWPFVSGPFGDPLPPLLRDVQHSLLDRPRATLDGRLGQYARTLAGGLPLLAGALLAPAACRTRAVLASAAVTLVALLMWANAPVTGITDPGVLDLSLYALRYSLPVLAAAALTVALAARDGGATTRRAAVGVLAASIAWSVIRDAQRTVLLPSALTVLAGAAAGAVIGLALARLRAPRISVPSPAFLTAGAAVAVAALLAGLAGGVVDRHARVAGSQSVAGWFVGLPSFDRGHEPIASAPTMDGMLAGPRLSHPLTLVPQREPCATVRARARRGWVVLLDDATARSTTARYTAARCLASVAPVHAGPGFRVYGDVRRARGAG